MVKETLSHNLLLRNAHSHDAKFFTPDAKTDSMARTRQDLRNDKIDTDQGESDAPPTPNQGPFPDATRSTPLSENDPVETEPQIQTLRPTPNPGTPSSAEP